MSTESSLGQGRYSEPSAGTKPAQRGVFRFRKRLSVFDWIAFTIAALFAIPVLTVAGNLFQESSDDTWAHLAATVLPDYIANTLWLAVGVGIGTGVIGVLTAWLVSMCRFPGRRLFEWALVLPLAVPAYVMAYAYTDFLQFVGPVQTLLRDLFGWQYGDYWFPEIRSLGGATTMMIFVLYPYVYLLARAAFLEQSICVLEASRTLGHSAWRSFFRVALPLARPAAIAGISLALMETLADFGTVSYFGVHTFTTGIYRAWFSIGDPVTAAQLSSTLLGFVLLLILLERWSRSKRRFHNASGRYDRITGLELRGVRKWLAALACLIPITIGFLLPAGILGWMAIDVGDAQFGPRFFTLAWNSFLLAGVTACLAVLLATVMAYGARLRPTGPIQWANRAAGMGYAVPGSIIAVGVLISFAWLDNSIDGWMRANLGISTGLLLTGTIAALVFAYLVRFLAVALQAMEASLAKVTPNMDSAARVLGRGPVQTLAEVHAPLMRTSILTAGLLVFVDVMKELPATLIVRPFNFDTLAVQAYNLAADERLAEASTASLTIVAVGLLPVILLSRTIARSRPGSR
ncbi:MAG: iron ABC transporter permease [Alphaproteobacteria bacterium]|nr:iron ABC transporter permease [Alphaproteobacteria bacterium]